MKFVQPGARPVSKSSFASTRQLVRTEGIDEIEGTLDGLIESEGPMLGLPLGPFDVDGTTLGKREGDNDTDGISLGC